MIAPRELLKGQGVAEETLDAIPSSKEFVSGARTTRLNTVLSFKGDWSSRNAYTYPELQAPHGTQHSRYRRTRFFQMSGVSF